MWPVKGKAAQCPVVEIGAEKVCVGCGIVMVATKPNRIWFSRKKFCTQACAKLYFVGENHPSWKEKPERRCLGCGLIIPPQRSVAFHEQRKYCTQECASSYKRLTANPLKYERAISIDGAREYKHRAIVERVFGRKLTRDETVHHINLDIHDNRNENLIVCSNSYHRWLHNEMARRWAREHLACPCSIELPGSSIPGSQTASPGIL